jgi:hypothetical protein
MKNKRENYLLTSIAFLAIMYKITMVAEVYWQRFNYMNSLISMFYPQIIMFFYELFKPVSKYL